MTAEQRATLRDRSLLSGTPSAPPPPRDAPRLAIYMRVPAETGSESLAAQYRQTVAEAARLGGVFTPAADVHHDVDLDSDRTPTDGLESLLHRVVDDGDYDGIVVNYSDLLRLVADPDLWRNLTVLLRENSCDLHVAGVPGLSLWGPGKILLDMLAAVAQNEARDIAARDTGDPTTGDPTTDDPIGGGSDS